MPKLQIESDTTWSQIADACDAGAGIYLGDANVSGWYCPCCETWVGNPEDDNLRKFSRTHDITQCDETFMLFHQVQKFNMGELVNPKIVRVDGNVGPDTDFSYILTATHPTTMAAHTYDIDTETFEIDE